MRKLLFLLAALLFGGAATSHAASEPRHAFVLGVPQQSQTSLTSEQRQANMESFELVWKTVRDSHYDAKLGGLNWEGVREELRPRLEKASSMDEARDVMQAMLNRLGHSHVQIIPATLFDNVRAEGKGEAVPGFDVRMVDGEAMVVRVSTGLPAAKAGVQPGWRIRKINDKQVAPVLAEIRQAVKGAANIPIVQADVIQRSLRGDDGQKVDVTFENGSGKEVTLSIPRARPRGNRVQPGQMPPLYVHFEAR